MGLKGTRVEGRRPIRRVSTVLPPGGTGIEMEKRRR